MNIDGRLHDMRERLERSRPCKITITFVDGSTTVTDPAGVIDIFRDKGPLGAIASIEADKPEYAGLYGALSVICRPVPNRRLDDYE